MDFLLALVASPLSKALEISFLTGFITAYRLESSKRLRGGVLTLPGWQKKKTQQALKRRSSQTLMRVNHILKEFLSQTKCGQVTQNEHFSSIIFRSSTLGTDPSRQT